MGPEDEMSQFLTFEELMAEIEKDTDISLTNLEGEIHRATKLMAKYMRYHRQYKQVLVQAWARERELELQKQEYYSGRGTDYEYRQKAFNITVKNATDLKRWIEGDPELSQLRSNIQLTQDMADKCELMIEQLKYRPNHIATMLEIRKFESGA